MRHVVGGNQRRRVLMGLLVLLELLKSLPQILIHAHVLARNSNVVLCLDVLFVSG